MKIIINLHLYVPDVGVDTVQAVLLLEKSALYNPRIPHEPFDVIEVAEIGIKAIILVFIISLGIVILKYP